MAFSASDRSKVEALLSGITTTMDSVGRSKRDARLVRLLHPEWPVEILSGLEGLEDRMSSILLEYGALEESLITTVRLVEVAQGS